MSFIYNMADTWNAVGTTFNGIYMNFTNGAGGAPVGAAASRMLRLDSNGTAKFEVAVTGAFTATPDTGNTLVFTSTGNLILGNTALNYHAANASAVSFEFVGSSIDNINAYLTSDAANIIAQRNGVNAQTFNIYRTFTDASNYERLTIGDIAGVWNILPAAAGTGNANQGLRIRAIGSGQLLFGTAGNDRWQIDSNAVLSPIADNTYDIGITATNRIANIFIAGYNKYTARTVASLPTAASAGSGAKMFVSNSSGVTFSTTVTGSGGAVACPVYSDGTQWRIG